MKEIVERLPHAVTRRRVKKRVILLCPGDVPQQVYIVRSGCVKMYRLGDSGEEQVAGFKTTGDIFPVSWAFNYTSSTMHYFETLEDSVVFTLDKTEFLSLLAKYTDIKAKAFEYLVKNHVGLMTHITALQQTLAVDKLLMMLYYMMVRHSIEKSPGEFWVKMKLRHATLAGLTGLTRETITTELVKLRKEHVVRYTMRHFIIYREPLKDAIGEDMFAEIQFS